ncbi:superoxide dismutase [Limnohabitans sp. 2KL-17]|uniref:superoxide dismutase family protein n=1 Tax=Limnohabitans sp. 2KL-17 TaxID=1100704 RepID=UPI000D3D4A32|nr:superoxide dismutase family protein [Limnohabitans sp. 2KL-17]PUE57259.1 superoxide dismutase [Limnohabitans sp. 2KL-17]
MKKILSALAFIAVGASAIGAEITVFMSVAQKEGVGAPVGTVRIVETAYGLAFYPTLKALPSGLHGFHIHENPSCAAAEKDGLMVPALAAGGHLDPKGTKKHGEPWADGHLGDLPSLYVAADGTAVSPVHGPRLRIGDVRNRSLMIHAGGDNHADHPMPLGGGGARVACGVIDG